MSASRARPGGIAHTIIRFTENVIPQEGEDIAGALEAMRTELSLLAEGEAA